MQDFNTRHTIPKPPPRLGEFGAEANITLSSPPICVPGSGMLLAILALPNMDCCLPKGIAKERVLIDRRRAEGERP